MYTFFFWRVFMSSKDVLPRVQTGYMNKIPYVSIAYKDGINTVYSYLEISSDGRICKVGKRPAYDQHIVLLEANIRREWLDVLTKRKELAEAATSKVKAPKKTSRVRFRAYKLRSDGLYKAYTGGW